MDGQRCRVKKRSKRVVFCCCFFSYGSCRGRRRAPFACRYTPVPRSPPLAKMPPPPPPMGGQPAHKHPSGDPRRATARHKGVERSERKGGRVGREGDERRTPRLRVPSRGRPRWRWPRGQRRRPPRTRKKRRRTTTTRRKRTRKRRTMTTTSKTRLTMKTTGPPPPPRPRPCDPPPTLSPRPPPHRWAAAAAAAAPVAQRRAPRRGRPSRAPASGIRG
ncbi:hypothetical protein I4F81_003222 [Pyropia yezoensis]|uniref:Uncharacterized protein n=1 Tax=Pyropia yezoensis TaxID=2788 RepID=A0ACC3BSH2_PYRYE|nr:hypothetical protein I4F81_003222 [Neopyropia yezoensis]